MCGGEGCQTMTSLAMKAESERREAEVRKGMERARSGKGRAMCLNQSLKLIAW